MNVTTFSPTSETVKRRIGLPSLSSNPIAKSFRFVRGNLKLLFFAIVAIFAIIGIYNIFFTSDKPSSSKVLSVNQEFEVVARTKDGKLTNGKLGIDITGAQKSSTLLVQGQRVIARNGKIFLVLNMELSNPYKVPLYNYPVDNFRLLAADGKKYAPTAHQGNVEIRPESTKTSNVGFVVPGDQSKFKVEVGDLNSEKTILEFTLK